jgi:hypothetical protein
MYPYPRSSAADTWAGVSSGLIHVAGLIVLILSILAWTLRPSSTPTTAADVTYNYTYNSSDCAPVAELDASCVPLETLNTGCTLGYLWTEHGVCGQATQAPTGTPCQSLCYVEDAVTTACDNVTGECNGNTTESRGYCNEETDLNATIPFDTVWLTITDPVNFDPVVWNYAYDCYLNMVRLFILDLVWTAQEENTGEVVGARSACSDYLDADFWALRGDCLTIEGMWLDPTVTPLEHYLNNSASPPQFRLCTFLYASATLNQSAIVLSPSTKKRDVGGGLPDALPEALFARRS